MSTAIKLAGTGELTPEQIQLITTTIAKGATKDELALFLYRCKSLGLDPLKPGQIYFIKYGTGPGSIVVGIEGFRSKAAKTGKLSGINRGVTKDEKGKLIGAWAEVHRKDWTHPAREEVPLSEYDSGRGTWKTMPETMLKKVAEAACLRMAFADDLGGVYIEEEMEQQKPVIGNRRIVAEQPEEGDGVQLPEGEYVIPYGPCVKMTLERAHSKPETKAKLDQYLEDIEAKAKRMNKPIPEWGKELLERVIEFRREQELPEEPGWEDT
jgi:phage recombination protein Bet